MAEQKTRKSDIECLKEHIERLKKHKEKNKQDKSLGRALFRRKAKLIKLEKYQAR